MTEKWLCIDGFDSRYMVSNEGRIYSTLKGGCLKTFPNKDEYIKVGFNFKGRKYNKFVHRLVAEYFCEGYSPDKEVNHKDGNRSNNAQSNLEWVTRTENVRDCAKRGTLNISSATQKRRVPVSQFTMENELLAEFDSIVNAAKITGCNKDNISKVCNGHRTSCGGYKWQYSK